MHIRWHGTLLLLVTAVPLIGCSPGSSGSGTKKSDENKRASDDAGPKTKSAAGKSKTEKSKLPKTVVQHKRPANPLKPYTLPKNVTLVAVTPEELAAFIARKTGERRAVLVDYWATWCAPCKKAFPHTLALSRKHARDGLVVISMSMDDFEQRGEAEAYLKTNNARIVNYIASDKIDPDERFKLFGVEKGIPMYRVYGPDGKLAATFTPPKRKKGESEEDAHKRFLEGVDEAVEKALGLR